MFQNRVVQRLITFFLADLKHARDLVGFSLAHEVRDGGIHYQNFESGDSSRFVDALEKILRDHALERFGESRPDLVLLRRGKNVDDTVDRFGSAGRMQGAEN